MYLEKLQLINFKNYGEVRLEFSSRINVLVGKNGSGKTNLLDAIHYLSLTKSAFSADNFSIRLGQQFFTIKGTFKKEKDYDEIFCSLQAGAKKILKENGNEQQKFSDHIGKYPVVLIAPDDTALVKEGSDERRKFFDTIISQLDKPYLEALMQYNYALKQRNGLLKMFAETNAVDEVAIESYDRILITNGNLIFKKRAGFLTEFRPVFKKYYNFIVADEAIDILYKSEVQKTDFISGLNASRNRDTLSQRTNFGIHKDDYHFIIGNGDLKRLGSQGQQKSFIIALKLAQFEIIKQHKKLKPVLLLDDIFDKLDDFRIAKLLDLIKNDELGQLFITDARPDRTALLLQHINVSAAIFTVEQGEIKHG
jgi:DNA replication and repair protein RecF